MVRDVGTVGVLRDGFREVEKGIEPGDWVVVEGMQRLRPGLEVQVEKYEDEDPADTKVTARYGRSQGPLSPAPSSPDPPGFTRPRPRQSPLGTSSGPGLAEADAAVETKPASTDPAPVETRHAEYLPRLARLRENRTDARPGFTPPR